MSFRSAAVMFQAPSRAFGYFTGSCRWSGEEF